MKVRLYYFRHNKNRVCPIITKSRIQFYDLTIVLDGTLIYTLNGKKYEVSKNQVLFLPPNTIRYREKGTEASNYISFNFLFDEDIAFPQYMKNVVDKKIIALISAFDTIDGAFDIIQKNIIIGILQAIIFSLQKNTEISKFSKLTQDTLLYIKNNYKKKLTIQMICESAGYSAPHLSRTFKKETGQSIMDYLIMLKIEAAKSLILEKELPLSEIAAQVGYDDYNYFTHLFKKRVGCSPLNYTKSLIKMN